MVLEGGIHVPAVLRWPAVLEAGTRTSQVVTATDLFPTQETCQWAAGGRSLWVCC